MWYVGNFYFCHPEYINLISIRLCGSFGCLFSQKSDWLSGVFASFVCKSMFPTRLHFCWAYAHRSVACKRLSLSSCMDGGEVQLHSFLTSARSGGEWSTSLPGRSNPVPVVFGYAKERRILVSHNTTVYMC